MSREIAIEAIWHISLRIDGVTPDQSDVEYTKDWIEKALEQNQDVALQGRLIIGCSHTAYHWIMTAMEAGQRDGWQVFVTDEDDIYGRPEALLHIILEYWDPWHQQDERWNWSQETIKEFFKLYSWAIVYIYVY